jgi:3,4-dihydroxy 2-butanone 4-phosphate synthase / GTP cyclohydrolase II
MVTKISQAHLPTVYGNFIIYIFHNEAQQEIIVLAKEPMGKEPWVRMHSSCVTGDIFGSKRCDCGEQLHRALQLIDHHRGLLIYLPQEGRGIGLSEKIRAYDLQEQGYDTVEANLKLGHLVDERYYNDAIEILHCFDVSKLVLLTNNPDKVAALTEAGFKVERQGLVIPPSPENAEYLRIKQQKLGHFFND